MPPGPWSTAKGEVEERLARAPTVAEIADAMPPARYREKK
jgi:hypothetical protein